MRRSRRLGCSQGGAAELGLRRLTEEDTATHAIDDDYANENSNRAD